MSLTPSPPSLFSLFFYPQLAIGTSKGAVLLFNRDTGATHNAPARHKGAVTCCAWNTSGVLAIAAEDKQVCRCIAVFTALSTPCVTTLSHTQHMSCSFTGVLVLRCWNSHYTCKAQSQAHSSQGVPIPTLCPPRVTTNHALLPACSLEAVLPRLS